MPFRERIRRVFGRTPISESSTPSSLTLVPSTKSFRKAKKCDQKDGMTWPENVYKPEEIPPPKYRSAPDKKHQDRLHAFSFGDALENFRRRSGQSQYSPHGSRMPSRIGSVSGSFISGKHSTLIQSRNASVVAPLESPVAEIDESHVNASEGQLSHEIQKSKDVASPCHAESQESGEALTPTQTAINGQVEGLDTLSSVEEEPVHPTTTVRVDSAQATEAEGLGDVLIAGKTITNDKFNEANVVPDTLLRQITALRVDPANENGPVEA